MAGVQTQNDYTTGHGCYPSTIPSSWSPDVFVNGKSVIRNGDTIVPHGCDVCADHGGTYLGTHTVKINSRDIQVDGDPISCGDHASSGSNDVFVDG